MDVFRGLPTDRDSIKSKFTENKIAFLNDNYEGGVDSPTKINYYRMFKTYILDSEIEKNKDVSNFTSEELEDLMAGISTSSLRIKRTIRSLITIYINYAIHRGINITGNNPMMAVSKMVTESINERKLKYKHIDEEELDEIIAKAEIKGICKQFTLILRLVFAGLLGKEACEITELTWDNIDEENMTINVVNRETGEITKSLDMSQKLLNHIKEAYEENEYVEITKTGRERRISFNNDGRIIKSTGNRVEIVSYAILRLRFARVMEATEKTALVIKDFYRSCKINLLLDIAGEKGGLCTEDFKFVLEFLEGKSSSSWHSLKNDFLLLYPDWNIEKELPGRKVDFRKRVAQIKSRMEENK